MELQFDIELTSKQQDIYDKMHSDSCRNLVCLMSRQIGKTVIAEVLLIEYLLTRPDSFNAYISPSFSQGRKVFSEIMALIEPTGMILKANASELLIKTKNNAQLKFFSMESPTAIRGYTINGLLVLDEAAYFPTVLPNGEDPYSNVIFPITKARKPKTLIISTPNGKQGFFYEAYLKALNKAKGYELVKADIYDDQLVTAAEIEEIKRTVSPLAFQQEFLVQFLDNALTVFPNFQNCFTIDSYTQGKCWCGIDPSSVGEDNTIITFVNEKNEVKQYKVDGELDEKYALLANYINKYNPVATYIESNSIGEVMYNEIRKKLRNKGSFLTFVTTNETKKEYISRIAVAIANGEIAFEKSNTLLFSELGTYTFKMTKHAKISYAAKDGYHDDTVSSLGLALQCKEDMKAYRTNQSSFIIGGSRRLI